MARLDACKTGYAALLMTAVVRLDAALGNDHRNQFTLFVYREGGRTNEFLRQRLRQALNCMKCCRSDCPDKAEKCPD